MKFGTGPVREVRDAHMICSVEFAEWMKERYFCDVAEPGDNMDMILRYCDAWNEAFFEEEDRKANDLFYPVWVENGMVRMTSSYPLTALGALEPVDFRNSPVLAGFYTGYSVLTTCAAFPGLQQFHLDRSREDWSMSYIVDEAKYVADRLWEKLSEEEQKKAEDRSLCEVTMFYEPICEVDCFSRGEFYITLDWGFVDNQTPFSYGPQCPDRLLSDAVWSNTLRYMLCDFYEICREEGIERNHKELYCAALCSAWVNYLYDKGIGRALLSSISLEELVHRADVIYTTFLENETDPEVSARNLYLFMISQAKREIEAFDFDVASRFKETIGEALRNRENALRAYMSPQEKYGGRTEELDLDSMILT